MPRVKVPVPAQPTTPVMEAPAQVVQPANTESNTPLLQRINKNKIVPFAVAAVFLLLLVVLFSMMQSKNQLEEKVEKLSGPSTATSADEIKELTQKIGKYYQLPTGETPTLATVSDSSKVRDQAFFKDSKNGDKVLLYPKSGEAILYRPSTQKIITAAPFDVNGNSGNSTSADVK